MRDPYTVLGVGRDASADEVKSAFRKLAKRYHPDRNADDASAKEKFAEIGTAYEILGDAEKRAQFDRGEIDADGKPRGFAPGAGAGGRGGFEGFDPNDGGFSFRTSDGGIDIDDILGEVLGGRRGRRRRAGPGGMKMPMRGEDMTGSVTVSIEELVRGEKVRLELPNGRVLDVSIPAGTASGERVRLRGQGGDGIDGGPPGDLVVTVDVAPHPRFRVEGADLQLDLPIGLDEAVLGGRVRVETADGAVELKVPAGTSGGRVLRLRGRGLPKRGGGRGDFLVTTRIVLPSEDDPELRALMEKWRAAGRHRVRSER